MKLPHSLLHGHRPVVACGLGMCAAVCIVSYFFYFAGPGLTADMTEDDLMNLWGSWVQPMSQHLRDILLFFRPSTRYRPVGSVFYWLMFEAFGFQALPYRIACYALMLLNIWLAYAIARRLTGSRECGALAALLFGYHGQFWPLYVNTGLCYDLLCFFFYATAFLYYLRTSAQGRPASAPQIACWSGLYILCLNSKEMAVSLPVVVLAHALLEHEPGSWRPRALLIWLLRSSRIPLAGAVLTALFLAGRMTGPEALAALGAYHPTLSWPVFVDRTWHYLSDALYEPQWLTPSAAGITFLALMAGAFRSRVLAICLVWMLAGILPIAFIPPRSLSAAYIPALALALYLAVAITAIAKSARLPARLRPALVFTTVLFLLIRAHQQYGPIPFAACMAEGRHIRHVYDELQRGFPPLSKSTLVLMLRDPFPESTWSSTYLLRLYSHRRDIDVFRLERLASMEDKTEIMRFDLVLSYERDHLLRCNPSPFRGIPVKDVFGRSCTPETAGNLRPQSAGSTFAGGSGLQ